MAWTRRRLDSGTSIAGKRYSTLTMCDLIHFVQPDSESLGATWTQSTGFRAAVAAPNVRSWTTKLETFTFMAGHLLLFQHSTL